MKKMLALLVGTILLVVVGCGEIRVNPDGTQTQMAYVPAWRPIVDMRGLDPALFEADFGQCQSLAAQQASAAQTAATNAVVGAVLFGLIAAAAGGDSRMVGQSAAVGAVAGGTQGGVDGALSQIQIMRNCMGGRGYVLLN